MKRLFIWIVLCCFGTLTAQTTLTFTGKDNLDNYVQLHHVVVENLTQNWADTLYYPDTILILSGAGLNDYENVSAFSLSQNVPNPFDGVTDFNMTMPYDDHVVITVTDMSGRKVTEKSVRLHAGTHTFRIWLNTPQSYLLTVKTSRDGASIKMVNNGNAGHNHIEYLNAGPLTYTLKRTMSGEHPYVPGDLMRYTGYALHDSSFVQSATIEQPVHEDELFELAFHLWEFVEQDGHFIDTNTLFIPDGQPCNGSCLGSMHFQVSGYPFGQTVQSEEDIQFLRLKMEHSYMGDLWISLSCPNGQSATLLKRYSYNSTSGCSNEVSAANSGWQQEGFGKAKLGQYNTDDGFLPVTARGICWDTIPEPTTAGPHTVKGTGKGNFASTLANLEAGTTYHFRAYAVNDLGTSYGVRKSFTTLANTTPAVTTMNVTGITGISAMAGGIVTDDGGLAVSERGICWATHPDPTVDDQVMYFTTPADTFSSEISGLSNNTTYRVRAFARNALGIAYGANKTFKTHYPPTITLTSSETTNTSVTVSHSISTPATITSDGVCWSLSSNFSDDTYRTYSHTTNTLNHNHSTTITGLVPGTTYYLQAFAENVAGLAYSNSLAITLNSGSYRRFYPAGDSSKVTKYGYLYTLTTAGRSTFCPPGWHLPSKADWDTLFSYVGSQTQYRCGGSSANIAKALASTTGWSTGDYSSVGGCAPAGLQVTNNETGFTAMPAGELLYFIGDEGVTEENSDFGTMASFWSGTAKYIHVGSFTFLEGYHYFWLTCNSATTHNDVCGASEARSARCVRNQ